MTPADNKSWNTLFSRFVLRYKNKYGNVPELNRYKEKWGFLDMVADLGERRALEVVDYFFELRAPHTTKRLFTNYADMSRIMRERAEDEELRDRLRKETEERVKNWSPRVERD